MGMKRCEPCGKNFATWSYFGKHAVQQHGVNREGFWRRANQIGDEPCVLVRTVAGQWFLMVQGRLSL